MRRPAVEAVPHARRLLSRRLAHNASRALLGLLLAATATGKALDLGGFRTVLAAYDLFPVWSLWEIALAMPVLEGAIASAMLSGRGVRWGAGASVLLHGGFAAVLTVEVIRGVPLENCGCFGVFLARPLRWTSPLEDLALVALSLIILRTQHRPAAHTRTTPQFP